jgi:peptidoglycan/LPS O-acetylase OafA/YrhL
MADLQLDDRRFWDAALGYVTVVFPFRASSFFPPGNWVLWSIGVEIWFSALFPLLVIWAGRAGFRVLLPAVLVLALAVRFAGYGAGPFAPGMLLNHVSDSVLGRLDEFCWGMLLAQLVARGTLARFSGALAAVGLALALGTALAWGGWYRRVNVPTSAAFYSLALDLGIFLVAGWLARGPSLVRRVLENRPLQLLGMMCYSIYLWHGIVLLRFEPSFRLGALPYLAYLGVVLLLSAATYRYVEFRQVSDWRELLPGGSTGAAPRPQATSSDGAAAPPRR